MVNRQLQLLRLLQRQLVLFVTVWVAEEVKKLTSQQKRPTSVYFEFETDAEALSVSYSGAQTDASVGLLNFSVFEDGLLSGHYALPRVLRPEDPKLITFPAGEASFSLRKGMKKVTLYLPLMVIDITAVSVSEGAKKLEVRVTDRFGRVYSKFIEK